MTEDWQVQARERSQRTRAIWIWAPIFLAVGTVAIIGGAQWGGIMGWIGAACGGILALWGFVYGTLVYIRTVDEQERDANLWGCYVGMCAYLFLFTIKSLLGHFGFVWPHADLAIFAVVMISLLAAFAWKRFR